MRLLFALAAIAGAAFAATHPHLKDIKTVYLLPMSNSLDQYLAARLTEEAVFQVVTDPQKADAIFTDKIGQGFEDKMDELYPAPKAKASDEEKNGKDEDLWGKDVHLGTFSRGRGTLFLIDRRTRDVLWSTYQPVHGSQAEEVNRRAVEITRRLKKDQKAK